MKTKSTYKREHPLEKRKTEAERIRSKYPDRIPIICERLAKRSSSVPEVDKKKYLVPSDLTMSQFQFVIRKRMNLHPDHALFFFVSTSKGRLISPVPAALLSVLYEENKDEDGFLYISYSGENTFG
mmetsp:Transcript_6539/g.9873  ORF Transcript_6539/g.9873 Transcript_6539/m.9873 type:complete len:126 (-) Transcript_6539:300-677(-)